MNLSESVKNDLEEAQLILKKQNNLISNHSQSTEAYELCKALRIQGHHAKAFYHSILAYKELLKISDKDQYAHFKGLLDYEFSILWFYVSPQEDIKSYGLDLSRKVLQNETTNETDARTVHDNLMFYTKSIGGFIEYTVPTLYENNWYYTTPAFLGDYVFYRLVNYQIADNGAYIIHDPNNIVKTQNLLVDHGIVNVNHNSRLISPIPKNVQGCEDIRLTLHENQIYGLCSSWEYCPSEHGVVQVLFTLDIDSMNMEIIGVLSSNSPCEKNWVWLSFPYIVYHWYPTIRILQLRNEDPNNIHVTTWKEIPSSPLLRFARGSSNAVYYKGQYWFIVHSVIDGRTPIRHYLHQFVTLNSDTYSIDEISNPFTFEDNCDIEFCTALKLDDGGATVAYIASSGGAAAAAATSHRIKDKASKVIHKGLSSSSSSSHHHRQ